MEKRGVIMDALAGVLLAVGYVYPTYVAVGLGLILLSIRHPFMAVSFGFIADIVFASPEQVLLGYPFTVGAGVLGLMALVGRRYIRTNRGVY